MKSVTKSSTQTPSGEVNHETVISQKNSGETSVHIISKLQGFQHDHQISLGAVNGKDAVSTMSDEAVAASLQNTLDLARSNAAQILSDRQRVSRLVGGLK